MHDRSKVPDCEDCKAFEENPEEYVEKEICPDCPWNREVENPIIYHLMEYITLLSAGCPVGRHELTDNQWRAIAAIKNEQQKIAMEEVKDGGKN